jgi:hypothetical protein
MYLQDSSSYNQRLKKLKSHRRHFFFEKPINGEKGVVNLLTAQFRNLKVAKVHTQKHRQQRQLLVVLSLDPSREGPLVG